MAKIEADKLELFPVEFSFEEMVKKVITVVGFRSDEKKQVLTVNVDNNIPSIVVGDDQRLSQVITNLMANAIKFTPEDGVVSLDISLLEEIDGVCKFRFEVADNGIGISTEQQLRLFNAFEQAEGGMSREYGGTGLGLVISKNIVELMGGSIWVESELGKGSKFIFTINLQQSEKKIQSVLTPDEQRYDTWDTKDAFSGKRMLLAEDIEINREILIALLDETGLEFDCAVNGKEALEMVEAAPDRYDIIFMDLQMPQMDGYEATMRIRALPVLQSVVLPIVALSANVFTSDIKKCFDAGMDAHLGKPLDIDKVFEVLRKYLK
jgi:CheY-like chemotaxis protein